MNSLIKGEESDLEDGGLEESESESDSIEFNSNGEEEFSKNTHNDSGYVEEENVVYNEMLTPDNDEFLTQPSTSTARMVSTPVKPKTKGKGRNVKSLTL